MIDQIDASWCMMESLSHSTLTNHEDNSVSDDRLAVPC